MTSHDAEDLARIRLEAALLVGREHRYVREAHRRQAELAPRRAGPPPSPEYLRPLATSSIHVRIRTFVQNLRDLSVPHPNASRQRSRCR